MMQIYLKDLCGKSTEIECFPTDNIQRIKELYQDKEGIPIEQSRLIYAGKQLSDGDTLEYYNIKNDTTLHVILRLNGGGNGFAFSDMNKIKQIQFTNKGPSFMTVSNGGNLKVKCINDLCPTAEYNGTSYIRKGFCRLDIGDIQGSITCPECGHQATIKTIGFCDALMEYKGTTKSGNIKTGKHTFDRNCFHEFSDLETDMDVWTELVIKIYKSAAPKFIE